jgi:hypothetical protein
VFRGPILRRLKSAPSKDKKGFVIHSLYVLPAVEAVTSCIGLINEIPVTGYAVLLAIKPHNTKLFYELHASSLVCLTRKSGSMARPLVPHGALTNTGIWPKSWRAISREYDVSGPLTLRLSCF